MSSNQERQKINETANYSPINLPCIIAKVFESIIYQEIYNNVNTVISEFQYGFMARKSTLTNLVYFSEYITKSIDT